MDALTDHRDQLIAEDKGRFSSRWQWWPDKDFEREHMIPQQEARYEGDVWEEPIKQFIAQAPRVTVGQVAKESPFLDTAKIGTVEQRRMAAVLTNLPPRCEA
jgi:predicted P-loop ATPase